MDEESYQERRQEKIREIRCTGRTWQWPDPVQHPEWTPAHRAAALMIVLAVLITALAIALALSGTWLPPHKPLRVTAARGEERISMFGDSRAWGGSAHNSLHEPFRPPLDISSQVFAAGPASAFQRMGNPV